MNATCVPLPVVGGGPACKVFDFLLVMVGVILFVGLFFGTKGTAGPGAWLPPPVAGGIAGLAAARAGPPLPPATT